MLNSKEDLMKKRVYKAVKVNKINLKKLQKEVEGKDIILGIDVAKWKKSQKRGANLPLAISESQGG